MISLAIGIFQIIIVLLVLIVPVGIFFLGYSIGKNAGYIKRVKETGNLDI